MQTETSQPVIYSTQELSDLFDDSLQKFVPDDSVRSYLKSVLMEHIMIRNQGPSRLQKLRHPDQKKAFEDSCTVRRFKASSQSASAAYSNLKGLADSLLFVCGFFPEFFAYQDAYQRKSLYLSFYMEQGSGTYSDLAGLTQRMGSGVDILIRNLSLSSRDVAEQDMIHMMDPDLYAYLSKYFVPAANSLLSTRQDLSEAWTSSDKKINNAIYDATFNAAVHDGIPRDHHLPLRADSSRGEPVVIIDGKEYGLTEFYMVAPTKVLH